MSNTMLSTILIKRTRILTPIICSDAFRAGNEPSYSGSARARLKKSSARAQLMS